MECIDGKSFIVAEYCLLIAKEVYTTTSEEDRGLRDPLIKFLKPHIKTIVEQGPGSRKSLEELPTLCIDLLRADGIQMTFPTTESNEMVVISLREAAEKYCT